MFLRTLLFGALGAFSNALGLVVATWLAGANYFESVAFFGWIALAGAVGFVGGVFTNLVNEYFGFYKDGFWERLYRKLFK